MVSSVHQLLQLWLVALTMVQFSEKFFRASDSRLCVYMFVCMHMWQDVCAQTCTWGNRMGKMTDSLRLELLLQRSREVTSRFSSHTHPPRVFGALSCNPARSSDRRLPQLYHLPISKDTWVTMSCVLFVCLPLLLFPSAFLQLLWSSGLHFLC